MRDDLARAVRGQAFFGLKKALQAAEGELGAGETVNAAGSGNLDGKPCVIVATNRRLLFVSAGLFGRASTVSISLPVSGVERGRGRLTVRTQGSRDRTVKVVSGLRGLEEAILNPGGGPVQTWLEKSEGQTREGVDHPLVAKPLEELGALLDRGEITPEEYAERRAKVLQIARENGL